MSKNTLSTKVLVAIYARYSSDLQREESIDAQFRAIEEYCKRNNYEIAARYADHAMSGSLDDRPEFQRMIEDSAKNKFDFVIVHKFDRFSRKINHMLKYGEILQDNGVLLLSATEQIENTPAGTLMKNVLSCFNQYTVENLSTEVMKGLKENAINCISTGGKCLGYDVINKQYVVNPREAEAVRMIFEMFDQGCGYTEILKKLNSLGYKTKSKNVFAKNSLHGILRNCRYKGEFVYNAIANPGKGKPRNSHKQKDESEIIRIPGGVPEIISVELFDRIQGKMDKNKHLSGAYTAKTQYLLTGLIYCGECNYAMIGSSRKPAKNREPYISYRCTHRDSTLQCKNTEIQRDVIENFVLTQLKLHIFSPNIAEILTENINKSIKLKSGETISRIKHLKREYEDLDDKAQNIVDAIADNHDHPKFKENLAAFSKRQNEIQVLLQELQKNNICSELITVEQVNSYIEKASKELQNADFNTLKHIVNQFVERVEITKDEAIVTFKVALSVTDSEMAEYRFSQNWDRDMMKNYVA